jgi:hypothetical protein
MGAMLGTRPTSGLLGITSGRALGERSRLPPPGTLRGSQRLLQHGNALMQPRVLRHAASSAPRAASRAAINSRKGSMRTTWRGWILRTDERVCGHPTSTPCPAATPLSKYALSTSSGSGSPPLCVTLGGQLTPMRAASHLPGYLGYRLGRPRRITERAPGCTRHVSRSFGRHAVAAWILSWPRSGWAACS